MMIRLAFAIATAIEPEILIVDEVLAVGDLAFQQKATARIRGMMAQDRLMVIVSHDLDRLRELCTRIVWMDHGQVRMDGPPATTIAAYQQHFQRTAA
jgi:ABC-type polysaccharide/polyol phosphate transport system ATPase subunit